MKVILNYDPTAGEIKDKNGLVIGNWSGLQYEEISQENSVSVDELIDLRKAGYTVEEISELRKRGLL